MWPVIAAVQIGCEGILFALFKLILGLIVSYCVRSGDIFGTIQIMLFYTFKDSNVLVLVYVEI